MDAAVIFLKSSWYSWNLGKLPGYSSFSGKQISTLRTTTLSWRGCFRGNRSIPHDLHFIFLTCRKLGCCIIFFAQSIVRNTSSHQQVSMLCIFLFVSSLQELRGSVLITCTLPIYVNQQNLEGNAYSQNRASVTNLVHNSCNCDQGTSLWNELWEHLQYVQYWQTSSNQLPQSNCEVNLMNLTEVIMDLTLNGSSIHRSWVFSLQLLSWKPPIRRNKLLHEIGVDFSFFTKISHWGSLLYQLLYLWSQWSLSNAMFCRARFRIGIQRLAMLVQLWWRAHCMATSMSKFRGTCLWW